VKGLKKRLSFKLAMGVKCILAQEWIKSVFSIIVELEELSRKIEKLLFFDVEISKLRLIKNRRILLPLMT
jgi:hypothetical protein